MYNEDKAATVAAEIMQEYRRARRMNGEMHGPHEAMGVILEEHKEFQDEVFAYNPGKNRDTRPMMRKELIQLAAMAMAAIIEVCDKTEYVN